MSAVPFPSLPHAACKNRVPTKALCWTCWDRPECLAWGLEHEPNTGIWGGHDAKSRAQLRAKFGIELQPVQGFDFAVRGR